MFRVEERQRRRDEPRMAGGGTSSGCSFGACASDVTADERLLANRIGTLLRVVDIASIAPNTTKGLVRVRGVAWMRPASARDAPLRIELVRFWANAAGSLE